MYNTLVENSKMLEDYDENVQQNIELLYKVKKLEKS